MTHVWAAILGVSNYTRVCRRAVSGAGMAFVGGRRWETGAGLAASEKACGESVFCSELV